MTGGVDLDGMGRVLDTLCPMHVLLDATGHISHAGPAFCKLAPETGVQGRRLMELVELRRPKAAGSMESLLKLAGVKLHFALRAPPRTELKGVLVPLPGKDGTPSGAVLNLSFGISIVDAVRDFSLTAADFAATDLTVEMLYLVEAKSAAMDELRRLNLRLDGARLLAEEQAFTDKLTGLKNRRALERVLSQVTEAGQRFAMMHIDLDHFKAANDTHGHAAGDMVLQVVAKRLAAATRSGDTLFRLGGDEFLLVLPHQDCPGTLQDLAERLIRDVERPIPFGSTKLQVSASIGASISGNYKPMSTSRMMEDADTALYAAKAAGRHGYKLYSEALGRMGVTEETEVAASRSA